MNRQSSVSGGKTLGVFLIVAGIVFLLAQVVPFDIGQFGWPVFVILAGMAFIVVGLSSRLWAGFVIPGSIVTMVGLVLAVQNTFGVWAAWSYAWALIFPFAVGIGIALLGMQLGRPEQVRIGTRMAGAGVVLFLVFGAFFEGVLHVSGLDLGPAANLFIPLVLIFSGVVLIVLRAAGDRSVRHLPPPAAPNPSNGGAV